MDPCVHLNFLYLLHFVYGSSLRLHPLPSVMRTYNPQVLVFETQFLLDTLSKSPTAFAIGLPEGSHESSMIDI